MVDVKHPISQRKREKGGMCEGSMFHIDCEVENKFLSIVGVGVERRMDFFEI